MMKKFKSHKTVEAAIITAIGIPSGVSIDIHLEGGEVQLVSGDWLRKHEPKVGGYFVRYASGYCSYSPADEFEGGNKPLGDESTELTNTSPVRTIDVALIARICHEVNRAYCITQGDESQPKWVDAPEWQQASAMNGVNFHLEGDKTPEESHASWLAEKEAAGWKYGKVKDEVKKTHPCFLPYERLPKAQRVKDHLFTAVVNTFKE